MEVHFVVAQEDGRSKKFRLTNEEYVVIGRSKTLCQVYIEDSLCSSTHTKISVQNNAIYIEDLNSKNGVFLNGVKIIKQRIYVDDKVRFGNSILFINHSRMDADSIKAATYHGKYSRQGNMTLELDSKSGTNSIKALSNVFKSKRNSDNKSKIQGGKSANTLVSQVQIKNAYLIDLLIAIIIFATANFGFYHFFSADYIGGENVSVFVKMFKGKALRYTIGSFIITMAIHLINVRSSSQSLGKKILGIN